MYGFLERPSKGTVGDLELGTGGYSASEPHDVAVPGNLDPGLGVSVPTFEDLEAVDSAPRCMVMTVMSRSNSRVTGSISVRRHPPAGAEPTNGVPAATSNHGGFGIGLDEIIQVVNLETLDQYHGVEELSNLLKTDLKKGIDPCNDEILRRRETFGSNTYPCQKGTSFWGCIWKAIQSLPSLLMMLAAVINSLLRIKTKAIHDGLYVETCIISAIALDIIVRAIIEHRQSRQFGKLSEEQRYVRLEVIRGGRRVSVSTNDIVVGDIVPLKNGVQVPANGVLFVANSLKIDEREITALHENVYDVQKDLVNDPFLFSGSKVIEGIGKMLVTRVGINTGWGEIRHDTDEEKPFQVYLKRIANSASWLFVSFASVAYAVQLCRYFYGRTKRTDGTPRFILGTTTVDEATTFVIKSLSFGIATIIVALPVGFPTAVLLNLAKTTRKMMSDNALVRRLSACEKMGYVTKILCHKNGILTSNEDLCRQGTKAAIQLCKSGGVKVCMVTDDDVFTAKAKATECGILWDAQAVTTGDQFRVLSDEDRDAIARNISVFAQASPSDIVLLVEALKRIGEIVAATGMGIHDSAILRAADVGLAMGIGGTTVAKENSHIIILDDNFVTILKVIQWCRSLYSNIQKYVQFRLTVSVTAVAICVVEVVFYDAFPVNAVQLLFLNLIVDIFGALALAYRPTANHLMGNPPVGIRDPLITKTMWFKLIIQVLYSVLFLAFIHSDHSILKLKHGNTGNAEKVKNTFIFNSLVFCLVFGEFEIRSADQTFKQILRDNMFFATITATIIFQMIVIQFLSIFISAMSLDLKEWLLSVLVGFFSQVATRFPLQAYQYYRNQSVTEASA